MNKTIYILIALLLLPNISFGTGRRGELIDVWIFEIYAQQIMTGKTTPFFTYLSSKTNFSYRVKDSADIPRLLENCKLGNPIIVFASITVGKKVGTICNYKTIAMTYQDVFLFVRKNELGKKPENVKTLGLIKGIKATDIAYQELLESNRDIESIIYPNIFEFFRNYKVNSVDAIALPMAFAKPSRYFGNDWKPIYKFRTKSVAVVMVSPGIDKEHEEKLLEVLFNKNEITKQVWQESIGLGPFILPN